LKTIYKNDNYKKRGIQIALCYNALVLLITLCIHLQRTKLPLILGVVRALGTSVCPRERQRPPHGGVHLQPPDDEPGRVE